jgi:hypothetical protein
MPHAVAALLVGAGIAAGARWLVREIIRAAEAPRLATDEASAKEGGVSIPIKDLGALVWDPTAGVYRPRRSPKA